MTHPLERAGSDGAAKELAAIVAVVAHPDDESLIAGGTLALAAAAGAETGVVSLTRGEHGPISDPALANEGTLGAIREQELGVAGALLGAAWTVCLHWPDGELEWIDQDAAADELAALLEATAPSAVLTFGEDGLYGHPDHVAARTIVHLAVERVAGRPICVYEAAWPSDLVPALAAAARKQGLPTGLWGLEPEAFGSDEAPATLVVDVRPVLARKLAALRAHRTQIGVDHLLAGLSGELAERFLAGEPWRLTPARGGRGCILSQLLGGAGA